MITTIKKHWIAVSAVVGSALTFAGSAFGAGTYFDVPETAVADLMGTAGELFTDLWVLIVLAIGIPLGFWAIRKIMSFFGGHR